MKKYLFFGISAFALVLSALMTQFQLFTPIEETITFFPLDESVQYKEASTTLTLLKDKKNNKHRVEWKLSSKLDRQAYLRQDLGLLYVNGRLKGKAGQWKQDTAKLFQEEIIHTGESAKYETISFHYAELHGAGDKISSSQIMSGDMLYVIDSPFSPLRSFRVPKSKQEREWAQVLDQGTSSLLNKTLEKASKIHSFDLANYTSVPLDEFIMYEDQPIRGFTQGETAEIIGKLWEGIYKNYYLGIKKSDGTAADPLNSTMPQILISKDKTHILLVTQTQDGESIILRQMLQGNH
ncbi:MAG TPA: hypothetical protein DCR24_01625 [Bacillus bacterium]|nr:hypothetical protein [Bacillus sp. (in: firmicutes)]